MEARFAGPLPAWLSLHPLFAGMTTEELLPLVDAAEQVRFTPGQVIFQDGDPTTGLYVLTVGRVQVAALASGGKTVLAQVAAPGVFGEIGVLDGQPRAGTAMAGGYGVGYFVPSPAFTAVLQGSSLLTVRLLRYLTGRLRQTNGRLLELPAGATPTLLAVEQG
jgi:CRP-like cAMP-binding protein